MYTKIRQIPFALQIKIIFDDVISLIGWIFLTIGVLFSSIFLSMSDFSEWRFKKDSPKTQAVITQIEYSNASENKRAIFEYHYEFNDLQGIKQKGISYGFQGIYNIGDEATVIFLEKNPSYSRIENLRKSPFGQFTLFVLIFPLVGGLIIFFRIPQAINKIRVLREGVLGEGNYVRMEATNIRINRQTVMKLFFELKLGNKTYETYTETHLDRQIRKLTDGTPKKLLYLPQNPQRAILLDNVAGNPIFQADGSVAYYPLFPSILYLLFPLTCLLIFGFAVFS
ncbi:MAG: hypothetical protein OHK0045_06330 [Raineya sp.]